MLKGRVSSSKVRMILFPIAIGKIFKLFYNITSRIRKEQIMREIRVIMLISFLVILSPPLYADMGAIVPAGEVKVEEMAQKAIIAHDGFEEILILSTDLIVSQNTPVLRLIPFPSLPEIIEVDREIWERLSYICKKHNLQYLTFYKGGEKEEEIKVEYQVTQGAHEITVVKVNDGEEFLEWVRNFLLQNSLPSRFQEEKLQSVVDDYLKRGINYFVLDIVDFQENRERVEPVGYAFLSRNFYYPVKISSLFEGSGEVELFVLSDRGEMLENFINFWPGWSGGGMSSTAVLEEEDLEFLHPEIHHLLGKRGVLCAFRHSRFQELQEDIIFEIPVEEIKPQEFSHFIKKN